MMSERNVMRDDDWVQAGTFWSRILQDSGRVGRPVTSSFFNIEKMAQIFSACEFHRFNAGLNKIFVEFGVHPDGVNVSLECGRSQGFVNVTLRLSKEDECLRKTQVLPVRKVSIFQQSYQDGSFMDGRRQDGYYFEHVSQDSDEWEFLWVSKDGKVVLYRNNLGVEVKREVKLTLDR